MPDENPNLIPPPSIGESKAAVPEEAVARPKRSKLWLVVLICVVAGIALGVFVYQQSIAPSPSTTPKPVVSPKPKASALPTPSPSPAVPDISVVTPQSNTITFPKAGEIRVYFGAYGANPAVQGQLIRLTTPSGEADVTMPGSVPAGDKMAYRDSGLEVSAGQAVTIKSFDRGDTTHPSYGWIKPTAANKCGASLTDAAPMVTWATTKAAGEPLVSTQCWADWSAPGDSSNTDYNDFLIILSYVPSAQAATTSPSPSASVTPTPSAAASKSPSPSPSSATASVTPTPSSSARVTMPEGSALPEAGVFEVTVGTVGIGLALILLGILGLLLI